jgi:hypothetical protein
MFDGWAGFGGVESGQIHARSGVSGTIPTNYAEIGFTIEIGSLVQ